jgi:integrase
MNQDRDVVQGHTTAIMPTSTIPELQAAHVALAVLDERAQAAVDAAKPSNTARAYALETACFAAWATHHGVPAIPADPRVVRAYLRELADSGRDAQDLPPQRQQRAPGGPLGYGSLMRALSAICTAHVRGGYASLWKHPMIVEMRNTLASEKGERGTQKNPIRTDLLLQLIDAMGTDLRGLRDRAILLVGWQGGGRRRSEIVAAEVAHFEDVAGGVHWLIPKSKTDQTRKGLVVPLPFGDHPTYCPVRALKAWLAAAEIERGFVFRGIDRFGRLDEKPLSAEAVSLRIKHYVEKIGLDPKPFAGHSIRSGFMKGVKDKPLADAMRASGHTTAETAIHYMQAETRIEEAAVRGVVDAAVASKKPNRDPPPAAAKPQTFRRLVRPIEVEVEFTMGDVIVPFFGARPFARELINLGDWIDSGLVELEVVSIKHALGAGWPDRIMSFYSSIRATGQGAHQILCALGWMFIQEVLGVPCHSRGGSSCAYAGGWADVAAEDGSIFVECGTLNVEKVPAAMAAGQKVLVLPYDFYGVVVRREEEKKLKYNNGRTIDDASVVALWATDPDMQPGYFFSPKDTKKIRSITNEILEPLYEKRRSLAHLIAADMPGLDNNRPRNPK